MINKYIRNSLYAAAMLGLTTACEPEIERETPSYEQARGNADFSTYVALGNSLTAGFADNALYREAQVNSYPAIIADGIHYINPNLTFNQPLMPEGNGVGFFGSMPIGRLVLQSTDPLHLSPTSPSSGWETPVQGPVHNLGVPGARVAHLLAPNYGDPSQGPGSFNPYFARFAATPATSVVEQAVSLDPTFFTLWIGNNDVLGYALAGGAGGASITPQDQFQQFYQGIVQTLVAARPQIEGALANIPDVTRISYVSFIQYNQLVLTAGQANQANQAYAAQINPGVREQVIYEVIENVITERALKEQIIPDVARAVVKQQIASQEPCSLSSDPEGCAETEIQSGRADQQIENLRIALTENYFLEAEERDENYNAVYPIIDAQLEANQESINADIEQTIDAYNAEQLPAENQAALTAAINEAFDQQITQLKAAGFYPVFQEGPNAFVMADDNPQNPLGIRHMREGERILLSAQVEGQLTAETAAQPKADKYILDANELNEIHEAIQGYNAIIAEIAEANTFAYVDINGFFNQVASGYTDAGTTFSAAFITGNAFSLDGVHLTQKGYALVAKRFIKTINNYYGSQIPEPNIRTYPAVGLPN